MKDDYRVLTDEQKAERKRKEDWAAEVIEWQSGYHDFRYERIRCYHFRLTHPETGRKLDYFPRSGKATWVGSNEIFMIEDIDKYLDENFKQPA